MRNVGPDDVWDHVAGFAPANDVGLHDFRETDAGSMLRVKGQDGYCPIGPGLVSGVDVRDSTLRTYINGTVVQEGPLSDMTFPHRLHPRRPVPPHHPAARRHRPDRHPGQLAADGPRRRRRGRGHGLGRLTNTVAECPAPSHAVGHLAQHDTDAILRVAYGGDWWAERDAKKAAADADVSADAVPSPS